MSPAHYYDLGRRVLQDTGKRSVSFREWANAFFMLEFYAYETMGGSLGNAAALAKCDFTDASTVHKPADRLPFEKLPENLYIRGPRYAVMFDRIVIPHVSRSVRWHEVRFPEHFGTPVVSVVLEPKWIGKSYTLEDTSMTIRREPFAMQFFEYDYGHGNRQLAISFHEYMNQKAMFRAYEAEQEALSQQIEDEALDAINDFCRKKIREEGFIRKIHPPIQISNDELDRAVFTDARLCWPRPRSVEFRTWYNQVYLKQKEFSHAGLQSTAT